MKYCKMYFFTAAQREPTGDKPAPVKCTVAYLLLCDWAWTVYQFNAGDIVKLKTRCKINLTFQSQKPPSLKVVLEL